MHRVDQTYTAIKYFGGHQMKPSIVTRSYLCRGFNLLLAREPVPQSTYLQTSQLYSELWFAFIFKINFRMNWTSNQTFYITNTAPSSGSGLKDSPDPVGHCPWTWIHFQNWEQLWWIPMIHQNPLLEISTDNINSPYEGDAVYS